MTSATSLQAVLGVDGLPLGDRAAVAVAGAVVAETTLTLGDDRSVPARIRAAFDWAATHLGRPPTEVRLVAVDDGQDGGGYLEAEMWLVARAAVFAVLDPAVITLPTAEGRLDPPHPGLDDPDPDTPDVIDDSSLRARAAALW